MADGKVLWSGAYGDAEAAFVAILGPRDDAAWRPSVDYLSMEASGLRAEELAASWTESERCANVRAAALAVVMALESRDVVEAQEVLPAAKVRLRCAILLGFHSRLAWRNVTFSRARIASAAVMGAVLGWMSSSAISLPTDTWRMGVFLFASVFVAFGNQSELPSLATSRAVVFRQTSARPRLYSEFEWALTYAIVSVPLAIVVVVLFSTLVYWPGRFASGFQHFLIWLLILFLFDRAVISILRCGCCAWELPSTAQALGVLFIDFSLLWSGYYLLRPVMPAWLAWACFVSPAFWAVEGLAVNSLSPSIVSSYGYINNVMGLWGSVIFLFVWWVVFTLLLPVVLATRRHERIMAPRGAVRDSSRAHGPQAYLTPATCLHSIALSFKCLSYDVVCTDGTLKRLLDNVTAELIPGTITALIGASGAGKTTLMNALAHRLPRGEGQLLGSFSINGREVDYASLMAVASYAQQNDAHFPMDTVGEALTFAVRLRRANVTHAEAAASALSIAEELHLNTAERVAMLGACEAKRLTLGVELAAGGGLLFADEPTSGLAAPEAEAVMSALVRVAAAGRSICVTLHQPSASIFSKATNVVVLAAGGRCVYAGEIGVGGSQLDGALEKLGAPRRPHATNPARWALEFAAAFAIAHTVTAVPEELTDELEPSPVDEQPLQSGAANNETASSAQASPPALTRQLSSFSEIVAAPEDLTATMPTGDLTIESRPVTEPHLITPDEQEATLVEHIIVAPPNGAPASIDYTVSTPAVMRQVSALCSRTFREKIRLWSVLRTRFGSVLALALALGLLASSPGNDVVSYAETRTVMGLGLAGPSLVAIVFLTTTSVNFAGRIAARDREFQSHTTSPLIYATIVIFVELSDAALASLLFTVIVYPAAHLRAGAGFWFFFALNAFVLSSFFIALAAALVFLTADLAITQIIGGLCISICFLFAGLIMPVSATPPFWKGLYYAVPTSHILRAITVNQFYCVGLYCPTIVPPEQPPISQYAFILELLTLSPEYDHEYPIAETGWAALAASILAILACAALVCRTIRAF